MWPPFRWPWARASLTPQPQHKWQTRKLTSGADLLSQTAQAANEINISNHASTLPTFRPSQRGFHMGYHQWIFAFRKLGSGPENHASAILGSERPQRGGGFNAEFTHPKSSKKTWNRSSFVRRGRKPEMESWLVRVLCHCLHKCAKLSGWFPLDSDDASLCGPRSQ